MSKQRDRMEYVYTDANRVREFVPLMGIVLAIALVGCGRDSDKSVKEPRKELAALNLQYEPDDFVRSAGNGDVTAVKLFLDAGMAADSREATGVTPLAAAALGGHLPVVKMLLDRGANVNAAAKDGSTPLIAAAERQRVAVLEALLSKKAGVNLTNTSGSTALHWAVRRGNTNAVSLLLKQGASTSIEETNEMTAADCAVQLISESGFDAKTSTNEMVVLLRTHGASFATRWLLGQFTVSSGTYIFKVLTIEPGTLTDARFADITNYLATCRVWLNRQGYEPNRVYWFQSQMATAVLKVWEDSEIPTAEPERTKVIQYHRRLNALLKEMRAGVPDEHLYRFPMMDDP
jgi:ankyrin repeat protein